ncbi:MAG: LapA family protein [Cypionkella sp.]|jgi:uncharacterized integral membrane protein|nr:LapA family protein [Cypionkella sp.]
MFRYLRYAFLAALALVLVTLALANRNPVVLRALPDTPATFLGFQWQMELPLYAVIFGGILAGVLIGFVWEWLREYKHRAEASSKARQVARLERELAVMRDTKPGSKDDVLAILDQRKTG